MLTGYYFAFRFLHEQKYDAAVITNTNMLSTFVLSAVVLSPADMYGVIHLYVCS